MESGFLKGDHDAYQASMFDTRQRFAKSICEWRMENLAVADGADLGCGSGDMRIDLRDFRSADAMRSRAKFGRR